jgi:hypothetical protein
MIHRTSETESAGDPTNPPSKEGGAGVIVTFQIFDP